VSSFEDTTPPNNQTSTLYADILKRIFMSLQEQIKENLIKEIYTDIDKMYDFMEQHYILSYEHQELIIKQLNKVKDQFYLISSNSKLS